MTSIPPPKSVCEAVMEVGKIIAADAALVEEYLEKVTSRDVIGDGKLRDAMRYSLLGGGKRIRAVLVLETCRAFGRDPMEALDFAAALEMIQSYSLIHDDLPCMDDDDMRRGKPSCHKAFGEATALLAGDALLTCAFERAASHPCEKAAAIGCRTLARLAGPLGMAGGQQIDLEGSSADLTELKRLHSMKTAALIKAAALLGHIAATGGVTDKGAVDAISEYCECIGLAFQIRDDLLDLIGDAAILGKKTGIDSENGRVNALSFMTPNEAETECARLSERAAEVIAPYDTEGFLRELPRYLDKRVK